MAGLLIDPIPVERTLSATLQRWAGEPFRLRHANCAFSVLDYVEAVGGCRAEPDPRAQFNPAAVVRAKGTLEAACRDVMRGLAWSIVDDEARGDVGLVELPDGLTACICVASQVGDSLPTWVARAPRGFVQHPAKAALAWRSPCRRH